MAVEIERFINGKLVKVPLSKASDPKPQTDEQRLRNYRGERLESDKDKKDGV